MEINTKVWVINVEYDEQYEHTHEYLYFWYFIFDENIIESFCEKKKKISKIWWNWWKTDIDYHVMLGRGGGGKNELFWNFYALIVLNCAYMLTDQEKSKISHIWFLINSLLAF